MQTVSNYETKRIAAFDYIKALCIFLVCLGHAVLYIFTDEDYNNPICKYIYAFHMPTFMTISGFFFISTFEKEFIAVIKNKSIQLLLPCLSFFLIIKISKLDAHLNFWYLKCLFCLYIIYYLLFKIQKNIDITENFYWSLIVILFFIVAPFLNRWLVTSYKIMFMFPFFGMGIVMRRFWTKIQKYEKLLCGTSMILSAIVLLFWKTDYIIYFTPIRYFSFSGFDKKLLIASLIRWLTGMVVSFFLITLFDLFSKTLNAENIFLKLLRSVGKYSLEIYLLQSFILEYSFIDYKKFGLDKIKYKCIGGAFACIAIAVSMLMVWFLSKNKILNLVLFGRRK